MTTTTPITLPAPGTLLPAQGGYFHGVVMLDGRLFGEVTGRKADTQTTGAWLASYTDVPGARHDFDSLANTQVMVKVGSPIAQAALACRAGGFDDWAVPARGSQLLQWAMRDALPAADAFDKAWHWSSTQYSRNLAFFQDFDRGHPDPLYKDWEGGCARFVRRFPIESLIA